ncbi:MAG TPA: hypothetical protein VIL33_08375 [Rhodothermia bacterium]
MIPSEPPIESNTDGPAQGWNELGFVPWRSFQRMAPSILQLEVTRLGELISAAGALDIRNALVKSRYELTAFIAALEKEGSPDKLETSRLQAAIVNLPLEYPGIDSETGETLAYILNRLQYVHNRIRFVYQ